MITLDATNKSLTILVNTASTSTAIAFSTVSYWLVDALNVWTPHSETVVSNVGISNSTPTIILPAPSAGESKVIENLWVKAVSGTFTLNVSIDIAGNQNVLWEKSNFSINGTLILDRDGLFTVVV